MARKMWIFCVWVLILKLGEWQGCFQLNGGSMLMLIFLSAAVLTCRPAVDKTRNCLLKLDNDILQVKHRKIVWRQVFMRGS